MTATHGEATDLDGGDKSGGAAASVTATKDKPSRIDWRGVLELAAPKVHQETDLIGLPPSLRRLHYLLVSDPLAVAYGYVNTTSCYKQLSAHTTKARDLGTFPQLHDQTRDIEHARGYRNPSTLLRSMAHGYRTDRAALMPVKVILLAEKAGVVPLLRSRFDWLDVSAVRGYASVSHARDLAALHDPERETIGVYIGDYDPTGLDIDRSLGQRLPYPLKRAALNRDQVRSHGLPPAPAKTTDARLAAMLASEGEAVQVELDAMPSALLLDVVGKAIADVSGVTLRADGRPDWPDVDAAERETRSRLLDYAAQWEDAS